jgi:two-component SAPR family response regulator
MQEEPLKLARLEHGTDGDILIRFISKWRKVDYQVSSIGEAILEIERLKPDAVILNMNLYDGVGGVEVKRKIESQFDIPVWYE